MSNNQGPMERLWNGALLFAGAVLLVWLGIELLKTIWLQVVIVASIIGVVAGGIALAIFLFRRSRW